MAVAQAAQHLKFFLQYQDTDGAVSAAAELGAATKALLGPEALLKAQVVESLIAML